MDENEKRRAYSEIVEILKLIEDEEKLEKIPFEVIEMIKNNSDPTYKPEISKDIPLEEQNLSNTTLGILGWISKKFWEDDKDKDDKNDKGNKGSYGTGNDESNVAEETSVNKEVSDNEEKEENDNQEQKDEDNQEEKISAIVYSDLDIETIEKIEGISEKTNLPAVINKLNIYEKMIIKIMHFLRKIFKANHYKVEEGENE